MSVPVKAVELKIAAKDEATSVFKGALKNLKHFNQEARASGEGAAERFLKGAGAAGLFMLAVEGLAKGADAAREALRGIANGTMSTSEAIGHTVEGAIKAVPILGNLTEAFGKVEDAIWDGAAAAAKYLGASDALTESLKSSTTVREEAERAAKAQKAAIDAVTKSQHESTLATLEGTARERQALEYEFQEKRSKAAAEYAKERQEAAGQKGVLSQINRAFHEAQLNDESVQAAKLHKLDEDQSRWKEDQASQVAERLAEIRSHAVTERLRDAGLSLDAELEQLWAGVDKQIAELNRRADAEKDPEKRKTLQSEAATEAGALQNAADQEAAKLRDDDHRKRQEQHSEQAAKIKEIESDAATTRIRMLQGEGAAELAELKNKHDAEIAEINRANAAKASALMTAGTANAKAEIASITAAGDELKAALNDAYQAHLAETKKKLAQKGEKQDPNASLDESRFLTGVRNLGDDRQQQMIDIGREQLKAMENVASKIDSLAKSHADTARRDENNDESLNL